MNNFLIPANTKRSMLIFGIFRKIDLIIFVIGVVLTFILIWIIPPKNLVDIGVDILPLLVTAIMVMPIPNQMNIWSFTVNIYSFLVHQRNYRWRGWCMIDGKQKGK